MPEDPSGFCQICSDGYTLIECVRFVEIQRNPEGCSCQCKKVHDKHGDAEGYPRRTYEKPLRSWGTTLAECIEIDGIPLEAWWTPPAEHKEFHGNSKGCPWLKV
jgi:hypothetical protein